MQFACSPAFKPVCRLCEREPFAKYKNNGVCPLILQKHSILNRWLAEPPNWYVSICAGAAENSIVSNVCLKPVKWRWLLQSSFRYNLALNGRSIINLIKNCLLQWGWNWALHHNLGDLYKRRAGFGRSTFARNSAVCVQDCQKSTVFLGDGFVIFHTEQLSIYC